MKEGLNNIRSALIVLIILLSATIMVRGSNNMLQTTIPLYAAYDFSLSKVDIGVLSAIFGLATFITTGFVNSRLESRIRRYVFIGASISYASIFIFYFYSSFLFLWVITAFSGAILGMIMPNLITAAGLFPDRKIRERSLSLYASSLSLSLIIGPLFEYYVLLHFTLRETFLFFLPFGIAAALLSFYIRFPEDEKPQNKAKFEIRHGFKVATYLNLSYNIPFILITVFAGIYVHSDLGAPLADVTLYYTVFFATSFISRILLSFSGRRKLIRPVMLTMALTVVGMLLMFMSTTAEIFVISMAVLGIPHGLSYPLSLIYLSRSYESNERSAANSYFFSLMTIIMVAGPILGGYSTSEIGWRLTFLFIVPIVSILMIMVFLLIRKDRDQ